MPSLGRREFIIISCILLVLLMITGVNWWQYRAVITEPVVVPTTVDPSANEQLPPPPQLLIVHLSGAVHQPGVYSLVSGSRLIDVINLAGGALPDADLDAVNLAAPLADGHRYPIPLKGQPVEPSQVNVSVNVNGTGKININTADAMTLTRLPGIGDVRAKAIIDYRAQNGPFRTIEDIMKVSGIATKTFEQLRDQITVY